MDDCLFCNFASGKANVRKVYEDEYMFIIKDIYPKATYHFLAIPKQHFAHIEDATPEQLDILKYCFKKIADLTEFLSLERGFRLVINQGDYAGQTIQHLHIHILGGEPLGWTPA